MTGLERLIATSMGESVDRKPVVSWGVADENPDAVVLSDFNELGHDGRCRLLEVVNPFGLALTRGIDLNDWFAEAPDSGARELEKFVEEIRARISTALSRGFDGIVYVLVGANESLCTPMEYGGYYLERDRELLSEAQSARFNVLFVAGGAGTYLDLPADLQANAFAWDVKEAGVDVAAVRRFRKGALCANDSAADIFLSADPDQTALKEIFVGGAAHA